MKFKNRRAQNPLRRKAHQVDLILQYHFRKIETDVLRKKVKFISRMMKMQKTLREQNEEIVQLKGACPDHRIPKGLLLSGKDAIHDGISN